MRHRLQVYERQTAPLLDYYRHRNLLATIQGEGVDRGHPGRHPARRGGPMIELKSAREVGLMRRAGHILADVMDRLRVGVKPGMSTLEIDEDVEELHPRARGQARLQGISRLPGHRLHLDQRGSGARDPLGAAPGPGGRHRRPGPGVYRGRVLRRLGVHAARSARCRRGSSSCSTSPGRASSSASRSAGRAVDCPTSRTRSSSTSRAIGFSVVRAFVGHGIGRALHEEPQVPNFGDPGRGPQLRAGDGAGASSRW